MEKPVIDAIALDASLPLDLYEEKPIGTMNMPDGRKLHAVLGLSKTHAEKLKERSLDEQDQDLQRNTSDRERFGLGSYEDWYAKGRYPFALIDENDNLAALVWLGHVPNPLPSDVGSSLWDTIAFRAYPPYRGQGIMSPFSRFVLRTYEVMAPGRSIWLATDQSNESGIALYTKLGFVDRGHAERESRRILVLERM
ncbi:MAG: hypothetical protein AB199_02655 [Parcubacteria bacterium C7867-004]|nr:MAG: hypothetical protein AB199_02655 [Parcubacteria bacterium C7867-004]